MKLCSSCGYSLRDETGFCDVCGASITLEPTATFSPSAASHGSSATLSDAVIHLKAGEVKQTAADLLSWWQALRWEIRLAVVAACLAIPLLLLIYISGGFFLSLLLLPLYPMALLTLARPEPLIAKIYRFIEWCDLQRDKSKAKETFLAKWFFSPVYAGFSGSAKLTTSIKDPYLRTGLTLGIQISALFLALFVVYIVVILILVLLFLAFVFWIISFMLKGEKAAPNVGQWFTQGHSERHFDVFGNEYAQHYDEQERMSGYSENRTDIFGNTYQQHFSQEGEMTGHSEQTTDVFGNPYTQHYDAQDAQAGHSQETSDWLGNPYVQLYNKQEEQAGRSEARTDIFGNEYVKHEEE